MRRIPARRGSVLIHVLMLTVMMALIASLIMQMVLARATVAQQSAGSANARAQSEAATHHVWTTWASNQTAPNSGICSDGANVNCSDPSTPGACDCSCTIAAYGNVIVYAKDVSGRCLTCACSPKFAGETCPTPPISSGDFDDICRRW